MHGDNIINFDKFDDNEDIRKQAMHNAATGGPNSGFEIEGIDFFKQPELTDEFPEMKDDINLIISTEAYISKLIDFDRRIKEKKGMSRGMAHELLELIPSLESFNSPMHFTEDISGIGVAPSLEAISIKIWAIIAAATAFVIGLIYKFLNWLFGRNGGDAGSGDIAEMKKGVHEAETKVKAQTKIMSGVMSDVHDTRGEQLTIPIGVTVTEQVVTESHIPSNVQTALLENIHKNKNVQMEDGVDLPEITVDLHDALTNIGVDGKSIREAVWYPNKYAKIVYGYNDYATRLIVDTFDNFDQLARTILSETNLLNRLMAEVSEESRAADMSESDEQRHIRNSPEMDKLKVMWSTDLDLSIAGRKFSGFATLETELRNVINDADKESFRLNSLDEVLSAYDDGQKRVAHVDFNKMTMFFEALEKALGILHQFEQYAIREESRAKNNPGYANQSDGARSRMVTDTYKYLTMDLKSVMEIYGIISKVYKEINDHGRELALAVKRNAKALTVLYHKAGAEVPEVLSDFSESLAEHIEELDNNRIPPHFVTTVKAFSTRSVTASFGSADDEEDEADAPSVTFKHSGKLDDIMKDIVDKDKGN